MSAADSATGLGVAVDFDGVIHSYTQGWTGGVPQDPPVPGALEFVTMLVERGYRVVIHTTRARTQEGRDATFKWLERYGFPTLLVTNEKPKAILYLDDRGLRFEGSFDAARALLDRDDAKAACESWNKRPAAHPPAVPKADGGTYRDGLEAAAKVCDVHERREWDRRSTHEDDDAQIEAHGAYVMAGRLAAAIRALPGRGE